MAFTPYRYTQDEVARELTNFTDTGFARFARTSGVEHRSLALPIGRYPELTGFTEANNAYFEVATELGERAVRTALDAAAIQPDEVDLIMCVSSTGVAVPTIDATISSRIGFRPDVKRIPGFIFAIAAERVVELVVARRHARWPSWWRAPASGGGVSPRSAGTGIRG
jgi:alkylresorcinol/alkylpyrone synthase